MNTTRVIAIALMMTVVVAGCNTMRRQAGDTYSSSADVPRSTRTILTEMVMAECSVDGDVPYGRPNIIAATDKTPSGVTTKYMLIVSGRNMYYSRAGTFDIAEVTFSGSVVIPKDDLPVLLQQLRAFRTAATSAKTKSEGVYLEYLSGPRERPKDLPDSVTFHPIGVISGVATAAGTALRVESLSHVNGFRWELTTMKEIDCFIQQVEAVEQRLR